MKKPLRSEKFGIRGLKLMKPGRKGIRGNNIVSNTLNKEIGGKLAKKQKPLFIIVVLLILFAFILAFSIYYLGAKTGVIFAVCFSLVMIVINMMSNHQREEADKIINKHPWKAFKDNDE